jgi:hypothetical protein
MHAGFKWGPLKERGYLEALGVDGRIILKQILKKQHGKAWNGFSWLSIQTTVECL